MTEKLEESTDPPQKTKAALRKKAATSKMVDPNVSREQVAKLAHRFWAERGHQDGHHEEDWFRAEQELLGKAYGSPALSGSRRALP